MSMVTPGGEKRIFTSADSNRFSAEYNFAGGWLRVGILGVLDGADVSTLHLAATENPRAFAPIAVMSWRTSEQDTLTNIDAAEVFIAEPTIIVFQIENAGASTVISMWATPLGDEVS